MNHEYYYPESVMKTLKALDIYKKWLDLLLRSFGDDVLDSSNSVGKQFMRPYKKLMDVCMIAIKEGKDLEVLADYITKNDYDREMHLELEALLIKEKNEEYSIKEYIAKLFSCLDALKTLEEKNCYAKLHSDVVKTIYDKVVHAIYELHPNNEKEKFDKSVLGRLVTGEDFAQDMTLEERTDYFYNMVLMKKSAG